MERNVKRWYASCEGDLHIALFENKPQPKDYCRGCGGIRKLQGIREGCVSKAEADKGFADSSPLTYPTSLPPWLLSSIG
jgi:hypothetical protein